MGLVRGAVRHYCFGGCSALVVCARRSRPVRGGWSRCWVLCLPRFPLPAPRFVRCVSRAVTSGCPLSSLAGTPFRAVCAFRGLGPVALLVFPACPLCVWALALSRRPCPPPLPGFVWRAHLAQSRCWALVGPFHAVRAPLRVLPRSRAPFGLLGRGGLVPFPPTWLGAARSPWVGCRRGDPSPTPPRVLLRARFARCGGGTRVPGGAPPAWAWGVPGRALSHPRPLVLSGVRPGPTTNRLWVRGVRAWGPVTNPTAHALASWLCALWGRHEDARGGRLLPGCGASGVGRSPNPDHSSFRACGRGPLPTGCECGGCERGDPSPSPPRALLRAGFARCGGGTRVPEGGASCLDVGRRGSGALLPPTTRRFGRAAGPTTHWLWVRGMQAWGPVRDPTACALASWRCARWGRHVGARGGVASCLGEGRPGSGALPPLTTRPFGCAAGAHYPLAVGAGDAGVGTCHQPHSARSCVLALRACGGGMRVPWGGASCLGVRRLGSGAPPPPTIRSFGRAAGPTTHWLWARGVRAWGPVTDPTARALASWLGALWGWHEGAPGGRLLPGCGASGVRRSPTPDHSSFQACGRGPLPTGCGCGGCGRGGASLTPKSALLRAGFARCGGGTRAPGGGGLLPGCGASGVRRSPTPDHSSFQACGRGPLPTGCGCGGCGRGGASLTPKSALLRAGFARCGGGTRAPGGGGLLPGCGASGVRRSPTPDHSSFEACGRGPLPIGCGRGGCGRGKPSPTPQRALLRAGFARCGGGMRVPGGGASCIGVGRPGSGAHPPPTTRPFRRGAGAHYPVAVGAGGAGEGTRHQPHSSRSCELALRAVGVA